MTQPTLSLPSSPPSVQPAATLQTQLQGLTTTSSLLATTASLPTQTITSHVQQVPVSVFNLKCFEPCANVHNLPLVSALGNFKTLYMSNMCVCVFSGVATAPVHQSGVCAADYIEARPLHGYYCGLPHIPGHHHKSRTEHFTAGGNTRLKRHKDTLLKMAVVVLSL